MRVALWVLGVEVLALDSGTPVQDRDDWDTAEPDPDPTVHADATSTHLGFASDPEYVEGRIPVGGLM